MTTYETTIEKSAYNGWNAETLIPMGQTVAPSPGMTGGERTLCISTAKAQRGGIYSYATVYIIAPGSRMTEVFGDYRKHFNQTEAKMVNEKRIREAHAVALSQADAIMAEALAFYAKKEAA
jgi:hypothetical protein